LIGSISSMGVASAAVDAAICIEVLEHVPHTRHGIEELSRVMKPGGRLILIDKNIFGLHPQWCFPAGLYKLIKEQTGRWMYPRNGPFQERWFSGRGLRQLMRPHFSTVEVIPASRSGTRLRTLRNMFPMLSFDLVWRAVK